MKHLKIIGLCLVAVFAIGMTTAAGASAAPVWEQCGEAGSTTKYSEHQCLKVESGGKWSWQEVKATEKAIGHGTLTLADTKIPVIGRVEVSCSYTLKGTVGPGKFDRIETVEVGACTAGKNCETVTKNAEAVNLPWQTELSETTEKAVRDTLTGTGKGSPGWKVSCKVLGLEKSDECTKETGATAIESRLANGTENLVVSTFGPAFGKATCSVGGAESGEIKGSVAIGKENGWGLRAGPAVAPTPASIERVNFLNNIEVVIDHQTNAEKEKSKTIEEYETEHSETENFEWVAGKKNWPIAYTKGTKIKLEARFSVGPATLKFLKEEIESGSTVPIVAEMIVGTTTLTFKRTMTALEIKEQLTKHEKYIAWGEVESVQALPEAVKVYEVGTKNVASIAWYWTVKSKGVAYEQSLGVTEHNLYLTFAKAAKQKFSGKEFAVPFYLTVLDSDTQGIEKTAAQPPTEGEVIKGAWSEYETKKLGIRWYSVATGIIHRGGPLLKYYEEIAIGKTPKEVAEVGFACRTTSVKGLLETGKSQCHGWSEIFSFALANEGVSSVTQEVFPEFGGAGECPITVECWLLVKDWKFNGAEGAPPFPYENAQLEDITGAEGQGGVKNPTSVFTRHFIVEAKKGSEKLYDPSYGSEPVEGANRLKQYQEKYIEGFCNPTLEKCQKAPAALQLKTKEFETYE